MEIKPPNLTAAALEWKSQRILSGRAASRHLSFHLKSIFTRESEMALPLVTRLAPSQTIRRCRIAAVLAGIILRQPHKEHDT